MNSRKDKYYLGMARHVATRSYDSHTQVGAVIVKDDSVVATGFNGTPRGLDNECKEGHDEKTKECVVHAELNSIIQAARDGRSVRGATLYSTLAPCVGCASAIVNSGIDRVVWQDSFNTEEGTVLLMKANVKVDRYNDE